MEPIRRGIEDFLLRYGRVLVVVVLAAVAVIWASLLQTPTYEASAQVWVDVRSPAQGTGNGKIQLIPNAPAPETLRALTQTIIGAIDSRSVAQDATQRLGLQMDPDELLDNLTVEQVEGTSFILLTYEDTNPARAQRIVNTVGEVASESISERSRDLRATVFEKAARPDSPVSPRPSTNGLFALMIGLMLCAAARARPGIGARLVDALGLWTARQGIGQAEVLGRQRRDRSIVERVKEKKLLQALGRRGKLTAMEASLESELPVEEANRILEELAFAGHLEVTVEHGRLYYAHWGDRGEDRA